MPVQASAFNQLWVADASGTMQEWTGYVTQLGITLSSDQADVTTFRTGGYPVTVTNIHGAQTCEVKWSVLHDYGISRFVRQIAGAKSGFKVWIYRGTNAAPTIGDEVFQFTATLLAPAVSYVVGQTATISGSFVPVDGAALAPGYYIL